MRGRGEDVCGSAQKWSRRRVLHLAPKAARKSCMGENMCRCIYDMEVKERRKKVIDSELLLFSRRDGRSKRRKGFGCGDFSIFAFGRMVRGGCIRPKKSLRRAVFAPFEYNTVSKFQQRFSSNHVPHVKLRLRWENANFW